MSSGMNGTKPAGKRMSLFAIDVEEEEAGRWEDLPGAEGVRMKLRSLHCDDVQDWIADETVRVQKQLDLTELTGRAQAGIFRKAVGEKLLSGWEGLNADNGTPVIFTRQLALEVMMERKWRRLADAIAGLVVKRSNTLLEERTTVGEASASTSGTDSSSPS